MPKYVKGIPPPPSKDDFSNEEYKKRYTEWYKKLEAQIKELGEE